MAGLGDDSGHRAVPLPARAALAVGLAAGFAAGLVGAPARGQGGDDPRTEAPPAFALEPDLIRAAFLDLFGRPPLRAEREHWAGRGLQELLSAELGGLEFWDHWVDEQLYYFLLIDNFRPESERAQALPADLAEGRIGVQDAIHRIVLSSSFDQRNPGADTFVTVVMEQLLHITVQEEGRRDLEIGKRLYDGHEGRFLGRVGSTQADVVRICVEHEKMLPSLLRREHARLLRSEASPRALKSWSRRLRDDPNAYPDIVREWMLSPAYLARVGAPIVQPNRIFVRSLFIDLLDRLPEEQEARTMRDALDGLSDPGPLRSILAKLILDSGKALVRSKDSITDPTQWVAGLFRDLLGREASQEELKAFVSTYHEPDCRPEMVVYAIISHPEYHLF